MSRTLNLGRRVELVSMDPHCHGISIALYRPSDVDFLVHTYSDRDEASHRIRFVLDAMATLGGMERADGRLRHACRQAHLLATRRVFLETCKLDGSEPAAVRPLEILDKKSGLTIRVSSAGAGAYRLSAEGAGEEASARVSAIAAGLVKLAELQFPGDAQDTVVFPCGAPHDALVGLLLARALNVRAAIREQEMAATRGVLVAPSGQK